MIPAMIESHLRERHGGFVHHHHPAAKSAQKLAATEHVTGYCVAKPVLVKLGDDLAIAVVSAVDNVRLGVLEEATGTPVELAVEREIAERFPWCDPGAEPPLAVLGVPIFVDADLLREPQLVMPAGTYEDAVVLDTAEWSRCEGVQPIPDLGSPAA